MFALRFSITLHYGAMNLYHPPGIGICEDIFISFGAIKIRVIVVSKSTKEESFEGV